MKYINLFKQLKMEIISLTPLEFRIKKVTIKNINRRYYCIILCLTIKRISNYIKYKNYVLF